MTVNKGLLSELKESVNLLHKRLDPPSMRQTSDKSTAKKQKCATSVADKVALGELGKLNQAVHNIQTVQAEASTMFD